MLFNNFKVEVIFLDNSNEVERVEKFLNKNDLDFDKDIEYTIALFENDKIIATGSFSNNVLKCLAVAPEYKGMGLSNKIVSSLVNEEYRRGRIHLFIYTKPSNCRIFSDMGFHKVVEVYPRVVLLENDPNGIRKYVKEISKYKRDGKIISSIVMNCNPFTLGHKYLIEKASFLSDVLHIFVVWEENSVFPADIRYKLIREGTKHLSNVIVHKGKDYIISNATFPSYFIKEESSVVETHALLDLKIFSEYIVPALNINKRFVGEEPYCPVTRSYNEIMKKILPKYGTEVVEIPRLTVGDRVVSASRVREYLRRENFSELKEIVTKTTYDYLISKDAEMIIKKIKKQNTRH